MPKRNRSTTSNSKRAVRQRWRDYRTAIGRPPVKDFIDDLPDADAEEVAAAMRDVRKNGLKVARQLHEDIYEVRADGVSESYRLLFAQEGARSQILLSLHMISKHTQKTPPADIALAEKRLRDWRERGRQRRPRH